MKCNLQFITKLSINAKNISLSTMFKLHVSPEKEKKKWEVFMWLTQWVKDLQLKFNHALDT